jgi:diguanylate cyclase (GGDEF)-like protein
MGRYDPSEGPASLNLQDVSIQSSSAHIKLPPPFPATMADFPQPEKDGARVEIDGVIEEQHSEPSGRAWLSLSEGGRRVDVTVAHPSGNESSLLDAKVRIVGVAERVAIGKNITAPHIWVSSGSEVQLLEPPPSAIPLNSIRDLYREDPSAFEHRIRVRGRVAAVYSGSILLEDQWGAIDVSLAGPPPLPGAAVEVTGFPYSEGLRVDLLFSRAREIPVAQLEPPSAPAAKPIATIDQLRGLPSQQTSQALPVEIEGVITYSDPIWSQLYLQDRTAGTYVKYAGLHPELRVGLRVRLTGLSNAGNYAPIIVAPKFIMEGPGPLPVPVPATTDLAAAGLLDSQFVSIEGIVHPLKFAEDPYHPIFTFELYTSLGQVHVYVAPGLPDLRKSLPIEDARVRMQGVFSTIYNSRRQLVGYQMLLASPANIQVLEPAITDPFAMAATPIGSLLRFAPGSHFGHRVKIAGAVIMAGSDFVYVQDQSGGVEVRGDTRSIHLGEHIEAVGYPTLVGRYSPVMTDADFRSLPGSGVVQPQATAADAILRGNYDSQLVTLEGRLLTAVPGPGSIHLLLQSGIQTFTAELDTSTQGNDLPDLHEGSILRLTGVASAETDPSRVYRVLQTDPVSFKLLLRVPQDITVVQTAPFWTSQRTLALLPLLSLLIMAILIWVEVLRRRVARQRVALDKASQAAQAIRDLSAAMEQVSAEQKFDTQVSVRGSDEIAGLVVGFNAMLAQLLQKDNARRDAEARLIHQATIDELTGLPNRRLLADQLAQNVARARRENTAIGFLYIDLDGFKLVNDSYGHAAGDELLIEVGQRLRSRVRQADTLARIGGDEFTVILNHIDSRDDAQRVAESLLRVLVKSFYVEGNEITIGASIGISIFPDADSGNDDLLQQADSAMYAAKRNGKNQIVHFSNEIGASVRERLTLENELRRAISNGEIQVHYQPEFNLASDTIVRFEALARWTHPNLGVIPPLSFIPVAEDCGLIVALGAYVMERACRDALIWQQVANAPIQVAVNVSSVQFARESFVEDVIEILLRTGLPAKLLEIELTESATLIGIERAAATMRRLKELGVSVVMDDFGSGYSCLSYLPKLPFDALKIDRSFVAELPTSNETRALVQSILTLGHNLGMKIIVEGIETRAQLELMRQLGGDEAQGYLLGRPTPDPIEVLRSQAPRVRTAKSPLPIA